MSKPENIKLLIKPFPILSITIHDTLRLPCSHPGNQCLLSWLLFTLTSRLTPHLSNSPLKNNKHPLLYNDKPVLACGFHSSTPEMGSQSVLYFSLLHFQGFQHNKNHISWTPFLMVLIPFSEYCICYKKKMHRFVYSSPV